MYVVHICVHAKNVRQSIKQIKIKSKIPSMRHLVRRTADCDSVERRREEQGKVALGYRETSHQKIDMISTFL